ncbi:MAG: flagellar biosynthesis protein FlhB [Phycisphaerae bacterium]|nr:flagellar biosynthesis protein FlhB [Phycisphaerae bacterium]
MPEDMGERTEEPTSRKLADAREKGQTAKSTDLSAALGLAAGTAAIVLLGGWLADQALSFTHGTLSGYAAADDPILAASAGGSFRHAMTYAGIMVAPLMAIALVVALASQLSQTGILFSTKPIEPKLDRLDPIKGLGRVLGPAGLVKGLMSILKATAACIVAGVILWHRFPAISALPRLGLRASLGVIGGLALELAIALCVVLLILGVADLLFQRWKHKRDLRMTKSEVKDERRNMEGDMDVKRRRHEMYRKIAMNQIQGATPNADVVIANPTHFAVAIRYDADEMNAPRVIAKGADLLALQMRRLAKENRVPIVERPKLARALFWGTEVGHEIAPEHYEAVAEVLAFVYRVDERARDRAPRRARGAAASTVGSNAA